VVLSASLLNSKVTLTLQKIKIKL